LIKSNGRFALQSKIWGKHRRKKMSDDLKKEVWGYFKDMQPVFLATCDRGQPRVRPVTLLHYDNKFWVGTGTYDAKIQQIKGNNKVEICLFVDQEKNRGYIRGIGVANIVEDDRMRKLLSEQMPYFKEFWKGPYDPDYTLLEIGLSKIEYLKPGAFKVDKFSVG
jgi:uncharacterized pyridoxamine 5'-phosphate oxidase family protein